MTQTRIRTQTPDGQDTDTDTDTDMDTDTDITDCETELAHEDNQVCTVVNAEGDGLLLRGDVLTWTELY